MISKDISPFIPGDHVIYMPSVRGLSDDAMSPDSQKLVPFGKYVVKEIQDDRYVVVEGYDHPGGGVYWTEFQSESDGADNAK